MNINEIAKLAGVSPASVSRYLNNGYLSQEKRERIARVIQETGYTPSSQAQTLRTKRTRLIGVIIPKIDSNSISQVVAGISEVLSENGYQMLLANTENNTAKELDYFRIFSQNMVDGLILLGTQITPSHRALLKELAIPTVILGQKSEDFSCVYHDDYGAAVALTDLLIEKGYTSIGFLGVPEEDEAVGVMRKQGFCDSMKNHGLSVSDTDISVGSFYLENGYTHTPQLLASNPNMQALLCATDTIAFGAMKYLHEHAVSIPEHIALAGFGDSQSASILTPALTTVHFSYKECGQNGAHILLEQIATPDFALQQIKLGYRIIPRGSIKG